MVTIKDIAQVVGVSPTTVSNVINGKAVFQPTLLPELTQLLKNLGMSQICLPVLLFQDPQKLLVS